MPHRCKQKYHNQTFTVSLFPANTKHLYNIYTTPAQRRLFDVRPTLHKYYTNVLCLLGYCFQSFLLVIQINVIGNEMSAQTKIC